MSLAWVAGSVRAGLLAGRRVGRAEARRLAGSGSLAIALRELAGSPYGHELEGARSVEEAQRGVAATLLWHVRVLAGWLPAAAQLFAALARARQVRELAELVGDDGLGAVDRRYLRCAEAFEDRLVAQGQDEERTLDRTLELAWEVLALLPRSELTRIRPEVVAAHLGEEAGADASAPAAR